MYLVVYVLRYVMVLRRATSLLGGIGRGGPENQDFFVPKNVARLKTIKYKRRTNSRYIGNFMYTSVVALLCVVV